MTRTNSTEQTYERRLFFVRAHGEGFLETTFLALERSGDSVVITDRNGHIRYVNPAYEELTGYSTQEVLGKTPRILKSGKHPPEFYQSIWQTVLSGEVFHAEFVNRKKNGDLYVQEETIAPILDASGAIVGFISNGRDVTERRHIEKERSQAHKMEALGRLAGGVAHDFNNMLTVVISTCELLLDEDIGEAQHREIKTIKGAAERAAGLTRQLLTFSRPTPDEMEPMDLAALIRGLEGMLGRVIGKHVTIEIRTDEAARPILGSKGQLEQVVVNLAANARDAMPEGGRLTLSVASGGTEAEPTTTLVVSDTGQGMSQDVLSRLFEPFFTTKSPTNGTGLGLAQTHGIVKRHGGHITVQSEPSKGTTFNLTFPATQETPRSPAHSSTTTKLSTVGTEKILVAEADADRRQASQSGG